MPTEVTVSIVPRAGSDAAPCPARPVVVRASEHNTARSAARIVLEAAGFHVGALTFRTAGLLGSVEESAP